MSNIEKAVEVVMRHHSGIVGRCECGELVTPGQEVRHAMKALADAGLLKDPCTCGPWHPGMDGPEETCPQHGRSYPEWVEMFDEAQTQVNNAPVTRTEWGVISRYGHTTVVRDRASAEFTARSQEGVAFTREVTEWTVAP